jgi:outer membrane protein assembly factor BamB
MIRLRGARALTASLAAGMLAAAGSGAASAMPVGESGSTVGQAVAVGSAPGLGAGLPSGGHPGSPGASPRSVVAQGAGATPQAVSIPAACSAQGLGGGDWPAYGHDAFNTRSQPAENLIGPGRAGTLRPRWVFGTGDGGEINSTPVVAGGCVFVTTSAGNVFAVDATTGRQVWRTGFTPSTPGLGGALVGGAAIDGNRVVVLVNETGDGAASGPYAVALDAGSGSLVWRSAPLSTASGYYTNATPQVFGGVVFAGFSPAEGDSSGQGGFALLDAVTGAILTTTPTISPADQAQGFAGGGIWSTPAYDAASGFAYVGAGNPYSKTEQDQRTNAILKVDVTRTRSTFGQIVGFYHGNVDQYNDVLTILQQTPVCALSVSSGLPFPLDDPACGQLDLDFGASPNLFHGLGGRLMVGDLQKAGVYHVADAGSMAPVWKTIVGAGCASCNAASTAVSGRSIFGEGVPGGTAFSLGIYSGARKWLTPIGDGVHYQSVSTADGVVYTLDGDGFLDVLSAVNGAVIMRRPMALDAGAPIFGLTSGGIAIAYHTVFVGASEGGSGPLENGFLIAYQPGAPALP